jgi:hypothetical protein
VCRQKPDIALGQAPALFGACSQPGVSAGTTALLLEKRCIWIRAERRLGRGSGLLVVHYLKTKDFQRWPVTSN